MTPRPMTPITCWVLVCPDGRWWAAPQLVFSEDLAQRTADEWNSNLPRGEQDRLRVACIQIQEVP